MSDHDEYYDIELRERGLEHLNVVSEKENNVVRLVFNPFERSLTISSDNKQSIYGNGSIMFVDTDDGIKVFEDADEKTINIYSTAILLNDQLSFNTDNPIQELMEYMTEEIARIIVDEILIYLIDLRKANPLVK